MFEQAFVDDVGRTNRPWTVVVSAMGQSVVVASVILLTLVRTEALPRSFTQVGLPLVSPSRPAPSMAAEPQRSAIRVVRPPLLTFPTMTPRQAGVTEIISRTDAPEIGSAGPETGLPVSDGLSRFVACIGCTGTAVPPPAPQPTVKPTASQAIVAPMPVTVGGNVQAAKLIHQVKPVYPVLAVSGRISGPVRLEAIISREGTIQNLRLLSGHPLLTNAALEAVKQWRYRPTYLNGQPVEVITLIEVNFTLGRN